MSEALNVRGKRANYKITFMVELSSCFYLKHLNEVVVMDHEYNS